MTLTKIKSVSAALVAFFAAQAELARPAAAQTPTRSTNYPGCWVLSDANRRQFGWIDVDGQLESMMVDNSCANKSRDQIYTSRYYPKQNLIVRNSIVQGIHCYDTSGGADIPVPEIACPTRMAGAGSNRRH